MKYGLIACTIWCFASSWVMGQNTTKTEDLGKKYPTPDLVVLKTGKRIWGEVQTYEAGKKLLIRTAEGAVMNVPIDVLEKLAVGAHLTTSRHFLKEHKPLEPLLDARSFYHNFALFIPFGAEVTGTSRSGMGFEYTLGRQMSPRLGLGLTTGMNFMFGGVSDRLVPIVAEVRLYNRPERHNRHYLLLDTGYGLGWAADNTNDAYRFKGGWRIHPAIGTVWSKAGSTRITTELGFWHQRATLIEDWWENSRWYREDHYKMNRWLLKVGLLF